MKVLMTLARAMGMIKKLEQEIDGLVKAEFLVIVTGKDNYDRQKEDLSSKAKSNFDKATSAIKNLAELKSARNKANATTEVRICGTKYTIDGALAHKAALGYKRSLIQQITSQINGANYTEARADDTINSKFDAHISAWFSGTRKATEDEINIIKSTLEHNNKAHIIMAPNLREKLEELKQELDSFMLEVDYVLSTANATTDIEVDLI